MGFLFLDIETYSDKKNGNSSLNPYEKESKVLVISYSYYSGFNPPTKEGIKVPTFLKIWDYQNEKELLERFYNTLKEIKSEDQYLKFVGFNILKFDLPYLFGRMKILNIDNERDLYNALFNCFAIDLFQLSPILSDETIKRKQIWGIPHEKVSAFFGLEVKEGRGLECSSFYDNGEHDKIMNYCTSEFNLEQMLDSFYLYVLNLHQKK